MVLAVADIKRSVSIPKDAMRPSEPAAQWIAIGAILARAGAGDQNQIAGRRFDHTYGMALRIRQISIAVWSQRYSFRP